MRRSYTLIPALLMVSAVASAEITSTVTLTSDYDFRGLTQTDEDPALQLSLDYSNDSGWYAGAWASNVDYPGYDGSVELDLYTGFTGETEAGLGWDVGFIYYAFPSSDNTATEEKIEGFPEIYGTLSQGIFSGTLWYSNDFEGTGENAFYLEGNAGIPLPRDLTLNLHAGYSFGDYWSDVDGDKYFNYSAGLAYTLNQFDLELKYVASDRDDADDRLIFSVSTTFPWSR
jgi:uncharacterized protein (TIGR02001 family)